MKILIIEDEKLLADSLKTLLELKGFEVEAVYDGETGAEYAETGIYDLLILDVTKPFDNRELLACVNALLRRQGDQVNVLRYGNTSLDLTGYTLSAGDNLVRLSSREFDVMRQLMQTQGRSIKKETLLTRV